MCNIKNLREDCNRCFTAITHQRTASQRVSVWWSGQLCWQSCPKTWVKLDQHTKKNLNKDIDIYLSLCWSVRNYCWLGFLPDIRLNISVSPRMSWFDFNVKQRHEHCGYGMGLLWHMLHMILGSGLYAVFQNQKAGSKVSPSCEVPVVLQ